MKTIYSYGFKQYTIKLSDIHVIKWSVWKSLPPKPSKFPGTADLVFNECAFIICIKPLNIGHLLDLIKLALQAMLSIMHSALLIVLSGVADSYNS